MSTSVPASPGVRSDAQIIGLVAIAHATSHFFHLILAPLFPWIKPAFGLSYAELGLLMTVFFVVSCVVQALSGFLVDRVGARPVLFAGLWLLAASAGWLSLAQSYDALISGAVIAGLGNGVFHPVDYTLLNHRVSAPRLGHAFSMHSLSGTLGWAAAPLFLVGITELAGWRVALACACALALVVLTLIIIFRDRLADDEVRDAVHLAAQTAQAGKPAAAGGESALAFLKLPQVWLCWGFFLMSTVALAGIQSFAPTALTQVYGIPLSLATAAITAYMLCNAAGILCGGFMVGKLGTHDKMMAASLAVSGLMSFTVATGLPRSWCPCSPA